MSPFTARAAAPLLPATAMVFARQAMAAPATMGDQPAVGALDFRPDARPFPTFGFGHDRWWARIALGPQAAAQGGFLRVDAPSSDRIAGFARCGAAAWQALAPVRARYAVFALPTACRATQALVMEETRSVVRFPIRLLQPADLTDSADATLVGAVLGTIGAVVVFVAFLWGVTRERALLHFIVYQLSTLLVILRVWGYMPGLLLDGAPRLAGIVGVAGLNLWVLGFFNYVRCSLHLRATHKRLDTALSSLGLLCLAAIAGEVLGRHYQWPLTVADMSLGLLAYLGVVALKFRTERARALQQLLGYSPTILCFCVYLASIAGWAQLADLRLLFLLGQVGSTLALALGMGQEFRRARDAREARLAATVRALEAKGGELESYQNELETIVGARTAELQRALQTEREIVAQQRDFTSMIGHEFRTPLAIIDGHARRIEKTSDPLAAAGRLAQRTGRIREAVDRMIGLMDGLMLHARGEATTLLRHERTGLDDIVSRAIAMSLNHERQRDLRLDLQGGLVLHGDPALLASAVGNLLGNAAKYSQPGTTIGLRASTAGADVALSVTDEGIGIALDEQQAVFARFQRGSNALSQGGSGLGLHVARTIVERHGGSIALHSAPGRGTCVTIRLPISADVPTADAAEAPADAG